MISMCPRSTPGLPRKVPQSVPRRVTYTGKLRVKAGALGLAVSAAVERGPDRTHELADLIGRSTVQGSPDQGRGDHDAIRVLGGRHCLAGLEMPKPMITGLSVAAFRRLASTEELVARLSRSPVTPIRLTP